MTIGTNGARAVLLATVVTLAGAVGASAWAQNAAAPVVNVPANALSIGEIENRLSAQGIKVKEIKVRDLLAKVEGYDAQGREIEMVIDRRNGETLSHKYDDDDHKRK
ncbi:PepSY domain-containing protein [Steroidobacter flavus]|uniref:PepSY domain-containing protein n=1 Tax=Steroidobacter flavus TaxID=1842136 RepID=A0ABV8SN15_9GAMM